MRALVYLGDQKLEILNLPDPTGDFIVRVQDCAVCGTDIKTLLHGHPSFKPPVILGHEFFGVVEKAPLSSGYRQGDNVVVAPYGECGVCEHCRRGIGELCKFKTSLPSGAFCELVEVPPQLIKDGVIKLDAPEDAYALVEPLACVLCAMDKLHIAPFSRVLIVGGGPMGTLFALALQHKRVPVDVVEPNQKRLESLSGWGISVYAPGAVQAKDYDNIVVAVASPALAEEYVKGVGDNGTVHVFAGMPSGSVLNLDAFALHYRGVTVTGSSGFALRHFRAAYEIIREDPGHFARLITRIYALDQAEEAFKAQSAGDVFKVLIRP